MYASLVRKVSDPWRKGSCHTRIDRQTEWGNPFKIGREYDREAAVRAFASWLLSQGINAPTLDEVRSLKGHVLVCHCAPLLCHGHVLACIANEEDGVARIKKWLGWDDSSEFDDEKGGE